MTDLTVDVGGVRLNLRVGAIVRRGGKFMLCRLKGRDWWFLPGGRVKAGESSLDAVGRELAEEIGEGFRVLRPAICSENFFELEGRRFHEICTYYEVEWRGPVFAGEREGQSEIFRWAEPSDLENLDLKLGFLPSRIVYPTTELELVIHRDGDGNGPGPSRVPVPFRDEKKETR
jgi:ADP-ribose pyrophosphatase YjhB (NUDIX family)